MVGAMIRLGNCFDLLDSRNIEALQKAKDGMVKLMKREGVTVPENKPHIQESGLCRLQLFLSEGRGRRRAED